MKKAAYSLIFVAAVATAILSCAKIQSSATYEADQRYLNAWLKVNYPDAKLIQVSEDVTGVAVLEDEPGTGASVSDSAWIFVEYTAYDLNGVIQGTTSAVLSQQIGSYDQTYYYGPVVWSTDASSLNVGCERAVKGSSLVDGAPYPSMKIGGRRKFLVPIWLGGTTRYDKEEEYLSNSTSSANYIYDVRITDATNDITAWQIKQMEEYSKEHLKGIDTTSYGFYYVQIKEPVDTLTMSDDTTIYINYTGRLLSGKAFDTNIKDTAKVHHLYSASKTYKPSEVNYSSDYSKVTLGSSSVITGFAKAISQMKKYEKCFTMFFSDYGYGSSGSGSTIPAYVPLIFEIEMVDSED